MKGVSGHFYCCDPGIFLEPVKIIICVDPQPEKEKENQ